MSDDLPSAVFFDKERSRAVILYDTVGSGKFGSVFKGHATHSTERPFMHTRDIVVHPEPSPASLDARMDITELARTLLPPSKRRTSPAESVAPASPSELCTDMRHLWRSDSAPIGRHAAFREINCIFKRYHQTHEGEADEELIGHMQHEYFAIMYAARALGPRRSARLLIVPTGYIADYDELVPVPDGQRTPDEEAAGEAQAPLRAIGITFPYRAGAQDLHAWAHSEFFPSWSKNSKIAVWNIGLEIGAKMLDVLAQLHSVGVIHMDVKLANFIISYRSRSVEVRLVDFGLALVFPTTDLCSFGLAHDDLCEMSQTRPHVAGRNESIEELRDSKMTTHAYVTTYYARDRRTFRTLPARTDADGQVVPAVTHDLRFTTAAAREQFPSFDVVAAMFAVQQLFDPRQASKPWPVEPETLMIRKSPLMPEGLFELLCEATGPRAHRRTAAEYAASFRALRRKLNEEAAAAELTK